MRLSKTKRTFKKGYLPNWTEEMFTIVRCIETSPPLYVVKEAHEEILNRYIMFGRGICGKYQSRNEKFPKPIGEGN